MVDRFALEIADMVIEISSDRPLDMALLASQYQGFLSDKPGKIHISAHHGLPPDISTADADLIFDSGAVWKLHRWQDQHIITLANPDTNDVPYFTGVFTQDFSQGELYLSASLSSTPAGLARSPFLHPLPEVLTVCLLAQGRGVMMHACGI